ncbi:TPA: phenylalanine--tRNA ligase subunit alpha [Candidatus Poribacteria bacterium]|nr:phenylalanine--tRNA ligase subunit alpha [Candidatus Poribacteria bacterium]HIC01813.1 phenylalanine--tRNA ligase subunit alpha [Candidatus Poribacteria bacterium]HIC02608.1 phenylalanine--tRNA ligase subunit alpha [Candidatus Poribacteria bacterium]HIN31499.1 phenylalanine--tRNA ligase subunit alpha [Candidatus Poribacteria bacterium]HIO09119.1 phenylalanine--tRNA ligase subunit alpha [Candidatus Poribacteria bacterium]
MQDQLEQIRTEALAEIQEVETLETLEQLRIKYFGRKGLFTDVMKGMGKLSKEQKPVIGKLSNEIRLEITNKFDQVIEKFNQHKHEHKLAEETIDITLPGRRRQIGRRHPITQVLDQIQMIFKGMGFEVVEGPEIELEFYNFDALNTPKDHPARDLQDTFYIDEGIVLRTHTSPVQIRVMKKTAPPIRIIVPGKVYRRDYDITHLPMFNQVEGLLVDHHVTFSELKGVLYSFARQMFGDTIQVRFRPHFFPFTEPSAEVDISCLFCDSKGCRVCSHTGWLEILGSGLVDPNVFEHVNYDPENVTGFAFGMGVDRIAMLKFGITDLRLMFENDMRFAKQF